jgi:hypothetical protein
VSESRLAFGTPEYADNPVISGVPHWDDESDAWDSLTIGGLDVPGTFKVTVTKSRKIDVKNAPGSHGAVVTDQGYQPAKVKIRWIVNTVAEWETTQEVLSDIEPRPGKAQAQALAIGHPTLATRGITSVIIEKIDGPEDDPSGAKAFDIDAVEYLPPPKKSATGTPSGASGPQARELPTIANQKLETGFGHGYAMNPDGSIMVQDENGKPTGESIHVIGDSLAH